MESRGFGPPRPPGGRSERLIMKLPAARLEGVSGRERKRVMS